MRGIATTEQGPQATQRGATLDHLIRWVALAGVLVVVLVTTTSAYLRVTAAGLGCENWPACYGRQAALATQPVGFARAMHRVSATLAGTAVLAIGFLALGEPRRFRSQLTFTGLLLLVTAGLAVLGRATPGASIPAVAMGNVLGGMLMASLLWWLALGTAAGRPAAARTLCWLALLLVFAQIALGVLTSASYSGLACSSLASCTAEGFPGTWSAAELDPWTTATGRASAHMAHRVLALAAAAAVLAVALSRSTDRRSRTALLCVLALQLVTGVLLVALSLPLALAVAHNVCAILLLLALVAALHGSAGRADCD
jgi:cytochrome c oxidase assembly protein subunit 15